MTELLEEIETGTAGFKFKSTRVALAMEGHLDGDPWALGDALLEDVPHATEVAREANTGLFAKLEEVRSEMLEAGALTVAKKVGTLREARSTSLAWPDEFRRPELATYQAHKRHRSGDAEDRVLLLEKLHRRHRRRVTGDDLRIYRENQRRAAGLIPPPEGRSEVLERRIDAVLRGWASPQKFTQLHPDEQELAASLLERRMGQIRRGEFS